jgi:hypothetical protein
MPVNPFEHYAENPDTGEFVGWNGTTWVPVQARDVPGTTAFTAAQRQPQMRKAERSMQRAANPTALDKIGSTLGGLFDTTIGAGAAMGEELNTYQQKHPLQTLLLPGGPTLPVLSKGLVKGVQDRGTDMGTAIGEGNTLRAVGDAIAIGTAPVGGTMFADVADTIKDDPYRALGQAGGIAATFAAPKIVQAGMKATGPIGRSMQRAGARQGARAVGATRLPEMESLTRVDKTGHPQGPVATVLESPEGLPVARSQSKLYDSLHEQVGREGERVGAVKSSLQRGDYVLEQAEVQKLLSSIDDEMTKYAEIDPATGQPRVDPKTGRVMGSTADADKIIRNLENVKSDVMRSAGETGVIDVVDLFSKRDTWNQVYDRLKAGNLGKDLPPTSPAFARKTGADTLARTINEQIPELAEPNRAFSSTAALRDELRARLQPDEGLIGNIGRNIGPSAARGIIYGTATFGSGPFAAVAMGVAALDILRKTFTSTLWRTMSANSLYKIGKFLEAGELQRAAEIAQAELGSAVAAGSPDAPPSATSTSPAPPPPPPLLPPSSSSSSSAPSPAAPGLPSPRRLPELNRYDPYAVGDVVDAQFSEIPSPTQLPSASAPTQPQLGAAPTPMQLPPAPIDMLPNNAGVWQRGPINPGESGGVPPRVEQTITPTPSTTKPASRGFSVRKVPGKGPKTATVKRPTDSLETRSPDVEQRVQRREAEVVAADAAIPVDRRAKFSVRKVTGAGPETITVKRSSNVTASPGDTKSVQLKDGTRVSETEYRRMLQDEATKAPAKTPTPAAAPASTSATSTKAPSAASIPDDATVELPDGTRSTIDRIIDIGIGESKRTIYKVKGKDYTPEQLKVVPKRISANRRGQRIEGVMARSFNTTRGRALIVRADDGSERMVFESEVRA